MIISASPATNIGWSAANSSLVKLSKSNRPPPLIRQRISSSFEVAFEDMLQPIIFHANCHDGSLLPRFLTFAAICAEECSQRRSGHPSAGNADNSYQPSIFTLRKMASALSPSASFSEPASPKENQTFSPAPTLGRPDRDNTQRRRRSLAEYRGSRRSGPSAWWSPRHRAIGWYARHRNCRDQNRFSTDGVAGISVQSETEHGFARLVNNTGSTKISVGIPHS